MVSVLGFSFSGSGQNAGARLRPAQALGRAQGRRSIRRRRSPAAPSARSSRVRDAFIFALVPAGDPRARHGHRLHLPPAGPRRQRPRRAASRRATSCSAWRRRARCWPACAPTAWKTRRSSARHRPRPASALGVSFDDINAVLSTALGSTYVNDFPNARPAAARDRPGRRARPHAARRPAAAQRRQQPGQAGAAVGAGDDALDHRPDADDPLQRLSVDADLRRRRARLQRPARRWTRWSAWPAQLPAGFGFEWTGQSREERLSGSQAPILLGVLAAGRVPVPRGALRELVDPVRRCCSRCRSASSARCSARRLRGMPNDVYLQGRPDHRDRPVGEERDPDHRVRQGPASRRARTWSTATLQAVHLRFRPILMTSIAFILGVLPLVVVDGRRLGQPARDRHRRDGRHDHRDRAGGLLRAGVLRRRAPLLQGQRSRRTRRRRRPTHGTGAPEARRSARDAGHDVRRAPATRCRARRWRRWRSRCRCSSLIPNYERPAAPVPPTYPADVAPARAAGAEAAADIDWQRFFADPRLKRLIELALANNRDLRVAVLNIEQARALYQIRRADELPTVGVGAAASRAAAAAPASRPSTPSASPSPATSSTCSAASHSLSEAALAQYFATAEARKAAQISLVAAVANAYLTLLADDEQLRRHARHAGDARGLDPPHQAALRQRRRLGARLPPGRVAARRRARPRSPSRCASARSTRTRLRCSSASRCRPTCRRRCRSTRSRSAVDVARRAALGAARAPSRHPRRRAPAARRQRQHRRGARGVLPAHHADRQPRHREQRALGPVQERLVRASPARRSCCSRSSTPAATRPTSTSRRGQPRHRRRASTSRPIQTCVPRGRRRARRPGDARRAAARAGGADQRAGDHVSPRRPALPRRRRQLPRCARCPALALRLPAVAGADAGGAAAEPGGCCTARSAAAGTRAPRSARYRTRRFRRRAERAPRGAGRRRRR